MDDDQNLRLCGDFGEKSSHKRGFWSICPQKVRTNEESGQGHLWVAFFVA